MRLEQAYTLSAITYLDRAGLTTATLKNCSVNNWIFIANGQSLTKVGPVPIIQFLSCAGRLR